MTPHATEPPWGEAVLGASVTRCGERGSAVLQAKLAEHASRMFAGGASAEPEPRGLGRLRVTVVSAQGLHAADKPGRGGQEATSDPFVEVSLSQLGREAHLGGRGDPCAHDATSTSGSGASSSQGEVNPAPTSQAAPSTAPADSSEAGDRQRRHDLEQQRRASERGEA